MDRHRPQICTKDCPNGSPATTRHWSHRAKSQSNPTSPGVEQLPEQVRAESQKVSEPRKYPRSTADIPSEAARTRKMDGGIDWHQHRISQRNSVHQAAEGGQVEVQRPVEEKVGHVLAAPCRTLGDLTGKNRWRCRLQSQRCHQMEVQGKTQGG